MMPWRILCLTLVLATGCATTVPYTGQGPHAQVQRGAPVPPVDFLGNVFALPMKLLLWSWQYDQHYVSPESEAQLTTYLDARTLPAFEDTVYRLNQYRPGQDLARLVHNRHAAWPYRLLLGLPTTLIFEVLLPGRLFPWGDYYNPWTNTVHLYSDHAGIALHEAGHAHDFAGRRHKGTYAALRLIPFVDLLQEYRASKEALTYLERETPGTADEAAAYKILHPAFGSYVGSYFFAPVGTVAGVIAGHVSGRTKAAQVQSHTSAP
jgi:hypothetical protein